LPCEKYVEPTSVSGISSSGARCSQTRRARRSGRTPRGGRPRMVSTFSATASRSTARLIRWIFPTLSILDSTSKEHRVDNKTYKLIEIVGTSEESFAQAAASGVERASKTLHNVDWFEVTEMRGRVANGKVAQYQVTMKIGFRLDE
jgi:dodecin